MPASLKVSRRPFLDLLSSSALASAASQGSRRGSYTSVAVFVNGDWDKATTAGSGIYTGQAISNKIQVSYPFFSSTSSEKHVRAVHLEFRRNRARLHDRAQQAERADCALLAGTRDISKA